MSQLLLFSIGFCIFALTVVASLTYGYVSFTHYYDASVLPETLPIAASVAVVAAAVLAVEAVTPV